MGRERLGQFVGVDAAGQEHTVIRYRNVIAGVPNRGLELLFTAEGEQVVFVSEGRFEILHRWLGIIPITTTDPTAPKA